MQKIRTIIEKEWAEVFKNRLVLFSVAFLPLILTALPLITLATTRGLADGVTTDGPPDEFFGDLCIGLSEIDCTQVFMLNIYSLMFMMLPLIIPVTIAAYSIVGEKTTRSLEPILATPITTIELLIGKAASAVIPAIIASWLSFFIYIIGVRMLTNPTVFRYALEPTWLLATFLVGPLLAIFSVSGAVLISSRVSDPRAAEQLAGAVVLPIVLLILGQSLGWLLIDRTLILYMAGIVLVLDVVMSIITLQAFQRETILTRWK